MTSFLIGAPPPKKSPGSLLSPTSFPRPFPWLEARERPWERGCFVPGSCHVNRFSFYNLSPSLKIHHLSFTYHNIYHLTYPAIRPTSFPVPFPKPGKRPWERGCYKTLYEDCNVCLIVILFLSIYNFTNTYFEGHYYFDFSLRDL